MNTIDTKANFFRQSGWMMTANMLCGVFMAAAAILAIDKLTPKSDYAVFATVLRVFVLTSIPAAAMQILLAQQVAAAVTDEKRRDASAAARGVLKIIVGFWVVLLVFALAYRGRITSWLQASDPNLIWAVMFLILGSLLWPVFLGLLQGRQSFFAFGWSTILNGFSRFAAVFIGVTMFSVGVNGATYGALAGFLVGVVVAIWPARNVFQAKPGNFDLTKFVKRAALLAAGPGSTIFLINVDMLLVQGHFPSELSAYYAAAETIAIAVVTLCVPVAAVMFPKIVRSHATASSSDALKLALTGTILIACAAAVFCSIWPKFPLWILARTRMEAAPLLPWFMWAMVPVTVYNVLINNLIARERFEIIPWAAVLPVAYAGTLFVVLPHISGPRSDVILSSNPDELDALAAFKTVVQTLMIFSTTLMLISVYFSRRASLEEASSAGGGEIRSQPTDARP